MSFQNTCKTCEEYTDIYKKWGKHCLVKIVKMKNLIILFNQMQLNIDDHLNGYHIINQFNDIMKKSFIGNMEGWPIIS